MSSKDHLRAGPPTRTGRGAVPFPGSPIDAERRTPVRFGRIRRIRLPPALPCGGGGGWGGRGKRRGGQTRRVILHARPTYHPEVRPVSRRLSQIRNAHSDTLHGIAGSLRRRQYETDLSEAQDWLWSVVVAELERRHLALRPGLRCWCDLCVQPFVENSTHAVTSIFEGRRPRAPRVRTRTFRAR